ncbi:MAG: hypothetical protein HFI90_11155 [Clostridia bacterium]|nr:hypothetical protein [Clostridia bacterium]
MKNYVLEEHNMPKSTTWRAAAYGNGIYVAVGDGGVAVSSDGANWKMTVDINIEQAGPNHYWSVAYGNGRFVSIKQTGEVYVSTDGKNWTKSKGGAGSYYVTYGNGKFVSGSGSISEDGLTWSGSWHKKWTPESEPPYSIEDSAGVCYGNGKFVSLGLRGEIYTRSCDEVDWRITYAAADWDKAEGFAPPTVVYRNGLFFACNCQQVLMSRNGETWEEVVKLEAPKAVYNVMGMDGCYFAYTSGAMMESEDGVTWKNSGAAQFSVSCQGPNGFIGLYGDKCYSMMFQEYIPDAVTLVDGGEAPGDLRYMAAAGWDGAQVGQVFGKLDTATFGFRDIESCVPKNEKYVYCDGNDDHLKIQAAIDEVEDTGIPTVIYPVGECVLKVIARGVPAGVYQPMDLITLGDNMTLDGRYCRIILDFTTHFTETETDYNGFVTIFKLGNNSGIENCTISAQGTYLCHHRLASCLTYSDDGPNIRATGTRFINNKVSDITVKLDTMNIAAFGYIYLTDSVIKDNHFKNIDCTHCGTFINSGGSILQNTFENITTGGRIITTGGRYFMNNAFYYVTAPQVEVSGGYVNVSGNIWGNIETFGDAVISVSNRTNIVNNTIFNLALSEEYVADQVSGIYADLNSIITGNKIYFRSTMSGPLYTKMPLEVNGNNSVVTGNITNYTSIGEISGAGSVQEGNIATGQVTDQGAA